VMDNKTTFETGSLVISVGTAQQLTAHRVPQGHHLVVHADPLNDGYLYIGESKAKAEAHHVTLSPDANAMIAIDNATDVWVDGSAVGDRVEWYFEVGNADA